MSKRHKGIIAIAFLASVVLVSLILTQSYLSMRNDYVFAEKNFVEGNYQRAIELFLSLGSYRDSAERAEEAHQKQQAVDEANKAIIEAEQARTQLIAVFTNAIELFEEMMFKEAMNAFEDLIQFVDPEGRVPTNYLLPPLMEGETVTSEMLFQEAAYQLALNLIADNDYENAAMLLHDLGDYKDSATLYTETLLYFMPEVQRRAYEEAVLLIENMQYSDALERFEMLVSLNYEPAIWRAEEVRNIILRLVKATTISAGNNHSVAITDTGMLRGSGIEAHWNGIYDWNHYDIISVASGGTLTMGLLRDGRVSITGVIHSREIDPVDWQDIIAIAAGEAFGIGLRADGRVESFGHDAGDGQRNVSEWIDIIEIATGVRHTVGLRADGRVMITGFNAERQQEALNAQLDYSNPFEFVSAGGGWATTSPYPGRGHTVVLRKDGTVIAVGDNTFSQCDVEDWYNPLTDPLDMRIITISAGDWHTVGLRENGTVVTTHPSREAISAWNEEYSWNIEFLAGDVYDWTDIVAVAAGNGYTLALREDGTLFTCGYNNQGQRPESGLWRDIAVYNEWPTLVNR